MKATITKRFTFEAAHMLPDHSGKCSNLHGHSYKLLVSVRGPINEKPEQSDSGMVMDFGVISDCVNKLIDSELDHKFLNNLLLTPTAELIAKMIFEELHASIPNITSVSLYETEDSWVTVNSDDFDV